MCCLFLTLVFLGPRFFNFMWWLIQPVRYNLAFSTFIFPFLGVIFMPWTTLMYVIVSPGGVTGWDFMWLGIMFLADIASYAGGGVKERNRIPGYPGDATLGLTPSGAPAVAAATPATVAATGAVVAGAAVAKAEAPAAETSVPAVAAATPAAAAPAPTVGAAEAERVAEAAVAAHLTQLEAKASAADLSNLRERVEYIEGVGAAYGAKLNQAGVVKVMDLLKRGATRKGRARLVEATGIPAGLILTWVNHADLFRIKGVGKQFGELLEAAGVDTVVELAQRNPVNLCTKMTQVNAEKKLTGRSPRQDEVNNWVEQAKGLPRVVEY